MKSPFHERFNIQIDIGEARKRFINRIHTVIYDGLFYELANYEEIKRAVLFRLGERYQYGHRLESFVTNDFHEHLRLLEAAFFVLPDHARPRMEDRILASLTVSEVDLGIRWNEGRFLPSGAKSLDEGLVNEPLQWLSGPEYKGVLDAFQKGLDHFLRSQNNPKLRADVITDMYEAVEALAKKVAGNDKDLSANRQQFLKKVKASEDYKKILKEYIDFACKFRHAPGDKRPKPRISEKETESFIYLTGLFIRLAMS